MKTVDRKKAFFDTALALAAMTAIVFLFENFATKKDVEAKFDESGKRLDRMEQTLERIDQRVYDLHRSRRGP